MKSILLSSVAMTLALIAVVRGDEPSNKPVEVPTTGVHSIKLPTIETTLPDGPNKGNLIAACTLCHTHRYILMQPNFPRKTWIAEVEKMKKVYGAPIADDMIPVLVDYLVAIRGNGK